MQIAAAPAMAARRCARSAGSSRAGEAGSTEGAVSGSEIADGRDVLRGPRARRKTVSLSVGDRISKGQILCIIEAMKIMNEIESEFDGVVKEILAQNAHPVEYGQVLFRIDPNG